MTEGHLFSSQLTASTQDHLCWSDKVMVFKAPKQNLTFYQSICFQLVKDLGDKLYQTMTLTCPQSHARMAGQVKARRRS